MNSNILFFSVGLSLVSSCNSEQSKALPHTNTASPMTQNQTQFKTLTPEEEQVIIHKGTERPWTGKYLKNKEVGIYSCKRCGAHLFKSEDKFESGCGWPSFDDEIPGAIHKSVDEDGERTEITCKKCGAHLGHVFSGEGFTKKNKRHCVNSISLEFLTLEELKKQQEFLKQASAPPKPTTQVAYFAGGCFWGVEHYFNDLPGVISAVSGYMGGKIEHPSYEEVCIGKTGHAETVAVTYDPSLVNYETLAKLFFEIHDPTTLNRQGPDIGDQYRSAIFVNTPEEKATIEKLIQQLKNKHINAITQVVLTEGKIPFWKGEDYHQDWYKKKGTLPYCHKRTKKFDD